MKTTRKFKETWFYLAIAAAIVVGELLTWEISKLYGFRANPLTVAFLCIGLVAVITAVLYDGQDIG